MKIRKLENYEFKIIKLLKYPSWLMFLKFISFLLSLTKPIEFFVLLILMRWEPCNLPKVIIIKDLDLLLMFCQLLAKSDILRRNNLSLIDVLEIDVNLKIQILVISTLRTTDTEIIIPIYSFLSKIDQIVSNVLFVSLLFLKNHFLAVRFTKYLLLTFYCELLDKFLEIFLIIWLGLILRWGRWTIIFFVFIISFFTGVFTLNKHFIRWINVYNCFFLFNFLNYFILLNLFLLLNVFLILITYLFLYYLLWFTLFYLLLLIIFK